MKKNEKESFGTPIPSIHSIVKIDGEKLFDTKGNEFNRSIIKVNELLGGGFERVSDSLFDSDMPETKDQ